MQYKEYKPSPTLEKYIKCYYTMVCEPDALVEDKAFATGCIEVMFTLSGVPWQTKAKGNFTDTSSIELWGQILEPLTFRISGQSEIFGIRFSPAAAAFLLKEEINQFNNKVLDLTSVLGNSVKELHAKLQDTKSVSERIGHADNYLVKKFTSNTKTLNRI